MNKIVSIFIYPITVFIVYLSVWTILPKASNSFLGTHLGACEYCPLGSFCDCPYYMFLGQEISGGVFLFLSLLVKYVLPIFIGLLFAFLINIYVFRQKKIKTKSSITQEFVLLDSSSIEYNKLCSKT